MCVCVKQQLRNTPHPAQWPKKPRLPQAPRQALCCASALNTRGNTTYEVRPTDVLLPLHFHPHVVLIARLRKVGLLQQRLLVRPACGSPICTQKPLLPRLGVERLQRLLTVLSSRGPIAPFRRSVRARSSARTPACGSAGTGHRAVQLCVRWCTSSACRASASEAREPASARAQHQRLAQPRCLPLTPA